MHVGKEYPYLLFPDISSAPGQAGFMPPRNLKFSFGNLASMIGTYALQWADLVVVSDVGVVSADRYAVSWRIQHPTSADDFIIQYWRLFESPGTGADFRVSLNREYWHSSTVMGVASGGGSNWNNIIVAPTTLAFLGLSTNWGALVNPALLTRTPYTAQAAAWSDVPSYHPYRH